MDIQQCKDSLLKWIETPVGQSILYGINLLPNSNTIGLIFYIEGKQVIYFSIDCKPVNN